MSLPLIRRTTETIANTVNLITAEQMSRLVRTKQVDRAFIAFIRPADEEDVQEEQDDVE